MEALKIMTLSLLLLVCVAVSSVTSVHWENSANLDDNFRLLWNVYNNEITFEVQVRTKGYIGLGFVAAPGQTDSASADMVVGWVDGGQTYFQDRYINVNARGEPVVDPSQDYDLLLAYENATHTVMRFQRKLVTCDRNHDVPITNDTMRVMFLYHPDEPQHGSVAPGSLPSMNLAVHSILPLLLSQRTYESDINNGNHKRPEIVRTVDFVVKNARVPTKGSAVHWCQFFERNDFPEKHHMIKFEPIFPKSDIMPHVLSMVLYECQSNAMRMSSHVERGGYECGYDFLTGPVVPCNSIVASWTRGSKGLNFPQEAGFPLDSNKERIFMLTTHYGNSMPINEEWDLENNVTSYRDDQSGLRVHLTKNLRIHDAGMLSIGMNPEWRHIIPPGQKKVISEGHCMDECTRQTFPAAGISIFAVMTQTHSIGKEVKLRQIREQEDLSPIVIDKGLQYGYNEYRQISPPAKVMPGDSMVVECTYDTFTRNSITLGGIQERSENCKVLAAYYPRQKRMTTCHSLPSLPTLLHSVGIDKLSNTQPVVIELPASIAGMTLEARLRTFKWLQLVESFQRITLGGSFQAICKDARHKPVADTDKKEFYRPRVTKMWQPPTTTHTLPPSCNNNHRAVLDLSSNVISSSSSQSPSQPSTISFKFDSLFSSGHSTKSSLALLIIAHLLLVHLHQR